MELCWDTVCWECRSARDGCASDSCGSYWMPSAARWKITANAGYMLRNCDNKHLNQWGNVKSESKDLELPPSIGWVLSRGIVDDIFGRQRRLWVAASPPITVTMRCCGRTCRNCSQPVEHQIVWRATQDRGRTYYKCRKCGLFCWVTETYMNMPGAITGNANVNTAGWEGCD